MKQQGIWLAPSSTTVCWSGKVLLGPEVVAEEGAMVMVACLGMAPRPPAFELAGMERE